MWIASTRLNSLLLFLRRVRCGSPSKSIILLSPHAHVVPAPSASAMVCAPTHARCVASPARTRATLFATAVATIPSASMCARYAAAASITAATTRSTSNAAVPLLSPPFPLPEAVCLFVCLCVCLCVCVDWSGVLVSRLSRPFLLLVLVLGRVSLCCSLRFLIFVGCCLCFCYFYFILFYCAWCVFEVAILRVCAVPLVCRLWLPVCVLLLLTCSHLTLSLVSLSVTLCVLSTQFWVPVSWFICVCVWCASVPSRTDPRLLSCHS